MVVILTVYLAAVVAAGLVIMGFACVMSVEVQYVTMVITEDVFILGVLPKTLIRKIRTIA